MRIPKKAVGAQDRETLRHAAETHDLHLAAILSEGFLLLLVFGDAGVHFLVSGQKSLFITTFSRNSHFTF